MKKVASVSVETAIYLIGIMIGFGKGPLLKPL